MSETITLPGLVDPHVHFRQPGTNPAETIYSGTRAALVGGYAFVVDMPNNPGHPTWSVERLEEKQAIARHDAWIPIGFNAGSQPESDNIGEIAGMMRLAVALKGYGGKTTGIDRVADYDGPEFEPIIRELHQVAPNKPFLWHSGKDNLSYMINLVAKNYGHHLHVCHVNDPAQVKLVTAARKDDLPVTCGVCPHHLLKTAHSRQTEGKFAEMQPPLACEVDAEQLVRLLADGNIQIIETDHAPHTKDGKMQAEESGGDCFGVPGIEQCVPLMLYQVRRGNLTLERMVDAISTQPAALLGLRLNSKTFSEWDLRLGRIESDENLESGAGWSPYLGMITAGKLVRSFIGGLAVYDQDRPIKRIQPVVSERHTEI